MTLSRLLPGLALSGLLATAAWGQGATAPEAMTGGQIVKYVETVDMAEVKDAKMALRHSKNADVKAFARHMVKDHTANEKTMAALAKKLKLMPTSSTVTQALMSGGKAADKEMMAAKGAAFDKTYIEAQAKAHAEVAATMQDKLIPAAKNETLKSALTTTLGTVREHQKMAEDMAAKMP